ncbi:MAG TPA: S41 family peptidase [Steroidobacteraceae bacterium]|jgi:carboxyl-terminal processing protease|nr:S41 family peptidase [Steroidobacteraceae bacterium]
MILSARALSALALLPSVALLHACGGGGGGGSTLTGGGSTTSGWVQGQYLPESRFAALCASPRTGIDPKTGMAYPDRQGTALDEKNWLRSWTNDLYLWFSEVADQDPAGFATDMAYFNVLKTTATTASGKPKDRFHFTYATATWEALSQSGMEPGYGANFVIISGTPPRDVVISYTQPGSPAASAPANLARGAQILTIDGVDLVNASDQTSINTLNAGLSPQTVGESHTFSIRDAGAATPRTVTLVSADITETPVQNVRTIPTAAGDVVGYMLFNDHIATAEAELVAAFSQMKSAGVHDLILDIRYNGGGYLDIASEVAYMIAGPAPTAGQTFELDQFNSKYPTMNPVTQSALTPLGFHATTQGFSPSLAAGQALPTLNLPRVFVLTTASTCSASEAIINSLRGVHVEVIQIGTTTCGKPYAFYPADNCAVTYFSIEFQGVNAQNFGNYPDGFTPQNTIATQGVLVPGCSVADDFTHALGDPAEGLLASALSYRANGVCPLPPSSVQPAPPLQAGSIKSFWRQNRIYRPPASQ